MTFRAWMAGFCSVLTVAGPVHADAITDAVDQAKSQLTSDSVLLSRWTADQLKYVGPFVTTTGAIVPSQLKIWGVEAGVEVGASGTKVDAAGFHSLPTSIVNTQTIDTVDRFPFPTAIVHAKVGLPFGLDGGVRLGGVPEKSFDSGDSRFTIKNKIFGIDLRKKLIEEGITRPFGLTVGMNYTHANGDIDITTPFQSNGGTTVSVGGTDYQTAFDGKGTEHAEWRVNSFGLQAFLNKHIAFINPYVGASVNKNWGSVTNTLKTTGSVQLKDTNGAAIGSPEDIGTIEGTVSEDPNKWDVRGLAGIEFTILPFMRLGLGGEYAGTKNVAGTLGLRVQFR